MLQLLLIAAPGGLIPKSGEYGAVTGCRPWNALRVHSPSVSPFPGRIRLWIEAPQHRSRVDSDSLQSSVWRVLRGPSCRFGAAVAPSVVNPATRTWPGSSSSSCSVVLFAEEGTSFSFFLLAARPMVEDPGLARSLLTRARLLG